MSRFGTMEDFIQRMEEKRADIARRGMKLPQDYASIDEYEQDQMREAEELPGTVNRKP
jgi:hypothetical protein